MKPGDVVVFLHGKGSGVIIRIEKNIAWIETNQGIEIPFPLSELVICKKPAMKSQSLLKKTDEYNPETSNNAEFDWDSLKKNIPKVKDPDFTVNSMQIGESPHQAKKFASTPEKVWQIDLHIEELIDDFDRLSHGEILEIQLKHFHAFIKKAIRCKIPKVIIIHGLGTGRLKAEIWAALLKYPTHSVHDASMKKYGKGATEILLKLSGLD